MKANVSRGPTRGKVPDFGSNNGRKRVSRTLLQSGSASGSFEPRRWTCSVNLYFFLVTLVFHCFPGHAQSTFVTFCTDLLTPRLMRDNDSGLITAGPSLFTGTETGIFEASTDSISVVMRSDPGIGDPRGISFTRKLFLAISSGEFRIWQDAAAANARGCSKIWERFYVSSPPWGVSVTFDSGSCSFDHELRIPWDSFRSSALNSCGLSISNEARSDGSVTRVYSGQMYVRWEDFDSLVAETPVFAAGEYAYDFRISMPAEVTLDSAQPVAAKVPPPTTTRRRKTTRRTSRRRTTTARCWPTQNGIPALNDTWRDVEWLPSFLGSPASQCRSTGTRSCGQNRPAAYLRPARIVNTTFSRGWGFRGAGNVELALDGRCGAIEFTYGLDWRSPLRAGTRFRVLADGREVWRSRYTRQSSPPRRQRLEVVGVSNLTLLSDGTTMAESMFADPVVAW